MIHFVVFTPRNMRIKCPRIIILILIMFIRPGFVYLVISVLVNIFAVSLFRMNDPESIRALFIFKNSKQLAIGSLFLGDFNRHIRPYHAEKDQTSPSHRIFQWRGLIWSWSKTEAGRPHGKWRECLKQNYTDWRTTISAWTARWANKILVSVNMIMKQLFMTNEWVNDSLVRMIGPFFFWKLR